MLSPDMSRSLASLLLALAILTGCVVSPPVQVVENSTADVVTYSSVQQWLNLREEVAGLSEEQVVEKLVELVGNSRSGPRE